MEVGRVGAVRFAPPERDETEGEPGVGKVLVSVWVRKKHRKFVRINSRFFVSSASLIGARHLEIAPPRDEPGRAIRRGDTVQGEPPPHLDRMLLMTYHNLEISTQLIKDLEPEMNEVTARLAGVSVELELYRKKKAALARIVDKARDAAHQVDAVRDALARATHDGRRLARLRDRLDVLSTKLGQRLDSLKGRVRRLEEALDEQSEGFEEMEIRQRVDEIKRRIRLVLKTGEGVLEDIRLVRRAIDRAYGTVGALAKDREIYDDFKASQKIIKHTPWRVLGRPKKMSPEGYPTP
jgi:phospholipid/cholesterol/gamma-HCH transport system substrate-binding protein